MAEKNIALITYAVQSRGPVPSGLMLEGGAHLAGRLLQEGYLPTVYDFNNAESIRKIAQEGKETFLKETVDYLHEEIQKKKTRLAGFTLYTNGFKDNIIIAKELKKRNPGLLIAAGGPLVGWFEEEVLGYTDAFDVLVRGEGDKSIVELARCAYDGTSLGNVPGAIYQNGGQTIKSNKNPLDISTLPFPNYDPEIYPAIGQKIKVSTLRTSVGCRYGRCTFCIQPRIDGRYRERNIDDVFEEIRSLKNRYGIKNFRLSDPNPSPEHLRKLFSGLDEDVKLSCFAYSDQEYDFSTAAKNLTSLFIGIESMEPEALAKIKKTTDPERYVKQCTEMILEAKKHGIATIYANIVPFPNDTSERIRNDVQKVLELQPDFITALPLGVIPGTKIHRDILKNGDAEGVRLDKDFLQRFMLYELDLLQPPSSWQLPPWQTKVDGKFHQNPFTYTSNFVAPLAKEGIGIASDEIVLMAHMNNGGLSDDQQERRRQVLQFQEKIREDIVEGNHKKLEKIIAEANK